MVRAYEVTRKLPRTAAWETETPTDLPREPIEEVAREDSIGCIVVKTQDIDWTSDDPEQ